MRYWQILVDLPFAAPLDYLAPEGDLAHAAGLRCVVPLGRRRVVGIVVGVNEQTELEAARLKPVARVLDEISPLEPHWLALTRFAADYYQHAWGEVALPALPPALRQLPGPRYAQALARLRVAPASRSAATGGKADMVALGRAMLYDPRWAWHAAATLGARIDTAPRQYHRAPRTRAVRPLWRVPGRPALRPVCPTLAAPLASVRPRRR